MSLMTVVNVIKPMSLIDLLLEEKRMTFEAPLMTKSHVIMPLVLFLMCCYPHH